MGHRGPPKKPTELKLLQGVPGGEHKLNPNEPQPDKLDDLSAPEDLTEEGKEIWRNTADKLERLGLLTEIDVNALMRYCDVTTKWLIAKRFLDEKGFYYAIYHEQTKEEIGKGEQRKLKYMAQFPQVGIYNQLAKELTRLEQQFGMTPAARASLNVGAVGGKKKDIKNKLYG